MLGRLGFAGRLMAIVLLAILAMLALSTGIGYVSRMKSGPADARMLLQRRIGAAGADGAVIATMNLSTWEIEPGEGHIDHVAEARIVGTAIAQFHRSSVAPSRSLTYLPLRRSRS